MTTRVTLLGWLDTYQRGGLQGRNTGWETLPRDDDSGPLTKARGEDRAPGPASIGLDDTPNGQALGDPSQAETRRREEEPVTAVRGES